MRLLKRLKLGPLLPTLPERLTLARAQQLDYVAFLTLLLADEVQRRDQQALEHLLQAGFEDRVTLDGFDWTSPVQLDRRWDRRQDPRSCIARAMLASCGTSEHAILLSKTSEPAG